MSNAKPQDQGDPKIHLCGALFMKMSVMVLMGIVVLTVAGAVIMAGRAASARQGTTDTNTPSR